MPITKLERNYYNTNYVTKHTQTSNPDMTSPVTMATCLILSYLTYVLPLTLLLVSSLTNLHSLKVTNTQNTNMLFHTRCANFRMPSHESF
jgi:hypothetical protein